MSLHALTNSTGLSLCVVLLDWHGMHTSYWLSCGALSGPRVVRQVAGSKAEVAPAELWILGSMLSWLSWLYLTDALHTGRRRARSMCTSVVFFSQDAPLTKQKGYC